MKGHLVTGRVRGTIAALAISGALLASGCGTDDTAAVVNGTRIAESDARIAAQQINERFKPQTPLTTIDALNLLIVAPTIIDSAGKLGRPVTAQAARTQLTGLKDINDATVQLVQANSALQSFDATSQKDLLAQIAKLKVSVNPRFGAFSPSKPGIVESEPSWIATSPT